MILIVMKNTKMLLYWNLSSVFLWLNWHYRFTDQRGQGPFSLHHVKIHTISMAHHWSWLIHLPEIVFIRFLHHSCTLTYLYLILILWNELSSLHLLEWCCLTECEYLHTYLESPAVRFFFSSPRYAFNLFNLLYAAYAMVSHGQLCSDFVWIL